MKTFFEHAHTSVAGGSQVAGYLLGALQEVYLCPLAMACSQVAAGSQVVATSACHVSMHCCCTQHLVTISKFPTLSALLFLFAVALSQSIFVGFSRKNPHLDRRPLDLPLGAIAPPSGSRWSLGC